MTASPHAALIAKLDEREFYELMQAYRHAPMSNQQAVLAAFVGVQTWILAALADAPVPPAQPIPNRLHVAIQRVIRETRGFNERKQEAWCKVCRYRDPLDTKLHDPDCPIYELHGAWEESIAVPPATYTELRDNDAVVQASESVNRVAPNGGDSGHLFESGAFQLHSGASSPFKINCDALTDADWETLAALVIQQIPAHSGVEGVPRGGVKIADALGRYALTAGPVLIVDDVLTTGASMEAQRAGRNAVGVVVFARGVCPSWVTPLFQFVAVPPATTGETAIVLAQLRHAYHNLIGPDFAWDRAQRMRFADGLIAPQIERLERLAALPAPAPQVTRYPCHCGIGEADLLDWVDSGLTLTCRTCGVKTVVSLQADPAPASQSEPALALHYSGEASKPFWAAINATGDDALYARGCALQSLEQQTLAAVQSIHRPPDAPSVVK